MRPDRQYKPDSILCLCLFVLLGMILTSVVHAQNYLFGEPDVLAPVAGFAPAHSQDYLPYTPVAANKSWLLPGANGARTSFKDGMAHVQFDSNDEGDFAALLPVNTRLTFSMGVEENDGLDLSAGGQVESQEWYDRYRPMLYFSIGHRW